jgi:hypothetical protein
MRTETEMSDVELRYAIFLGAFFLFILGFISFVFLKELILAIGCWSFGILELVYLKWVLEGDKK